MAKDLITIHQEVLPDHYDRGIKHNIFQKYWHWRRFQEITKIVTLIAGPLLDVGCHGGTFTERIMLKANCDVVYGIDISPKAIKLASKRIPVGHFQVGDAAKLPFKNNFFEAVFCLEVLEHVDDPLIVLKEIRRVMKKGGYGVVLVPTDSLLFKFVWFFWTLVYPVWRHAHVQSFTDSILEKMITSLHFRIIMMKTFNIGMLKIIAFQKI